MIFNKTALCRLRTTVKLFYSCPGVYEHWQSSAGSGALCLIILFTSGHVWASIKQSSAGSGPFTIFFIQVRLCISAHSAPPAAEHCLIILFMSDHVWASTKQSSAGSGALSLIFFIHVRLCIILFTSGCVWYSIKQPSSSCGPLLNYFIYNWLCIHIIKTSPPLAAEDFNFLHILSCMSTNNSPPPAADHLQIILFTSGCV